MLPIAQIRPVLQMRACMHVCECAKGDARMNFNSHIINYTQVLQRLTYGRIKSIDSTQAASCCGARPSSDFEGEACPGQCFRMLQRFAECCRTRKCMIIRVVISSDRCLEARKSNDFERLVAAEHSRAMISRKKHALCGVFECCLPT